MPYKRSTAIVSLVLLLASSALAQSAVVAQGSQRTASNSSSTLQTVVSLDLNGVSFTDALHAIARQAAVKITLGANLESVSKRVTLHVRNTSVSQSFKDVLNGTPVQMTVSSDRQILFMIPKAQGAGAQGVITGKVIDAKSGKGIARVDVSLDTDARTVASDAEGSYRLNDVATGIHVVRARLVGYTKQTRSVTVGDGATVNLDFKLEPSANILDQVVVTGTVVATELKAIPNSIAIITAKQIEERGITRIDQLFRGDIPGLFSLNVGSNALLDEVIMFSRGATALSPSSAGTSFGTNPIKTYIDGVEMADSKYLSQIDPRAIERIEILTGPQASTIYGSNAINGVMQIFTKRGTGSRPQLNLGLSNGVAQNNFNSRLAPEHLVDAQVAGIEGRWNYSIGGSWNYSGSWTPDKQTERLSVNGGGRIALGKLTADLSARHTLTINRQEGDPTEDQGVTNLRITGVFVPTATAGLLTPKTQSLNGKTLGLTLGLQPFSWWSHDLSLGSDASTTDETRTSPGFGSLPDTMLSISYSTLTRTSERYNSTIHIPLLAFANVNITLGGDHWRTTSSSWRGSAPVSLTGTLASPNITRNKPGKNSGAFVQGQLGLKDALFFTYGIRADWNPNFGEKAKVKPGRYGVSYAHDVGPVSAKFRGSYGTSIRPPSEGQKLAAVTTSGILIPLFGLYESILANPDLGPEHQQGGEGGIELYLGSRATLLMTRYNQTVDNLISLVGPVASSGFPLGLDSVRSLTPQPTTQPNCSSPFRDDEGYCYRYQQQYLNVGSIRNQGWELQGSVSAGPFTTRGTYSWTKSRVIGVTPKYRSFLTALGSTFRPGRPLDFVPEHTWGLGLTYSSSKNSLSLSANGTGMRYTNGDKLLLGVGDVRLFSDRPRMGTLSGYHPIGSGYTIIDLNASHRFSRSIDGNVQVNNLNNYYQNDLSVAYASVGRQSRIGLRIRM